MHQEFLMPFLYHWISLIVSKIKVFPFIYLVFSLLSILYLSFFWTFYPSVYVVFGMRPAGFYSAPLSRVSFIVGGQLFLPGHPAFGYKEAGTFALWSYSIVSPKPVLVLRPHRQILLLSFNLGFLYLSLQVQKILFFFSIRKLSLYFSQVFKPLVQQMDCYFFLLNKLYHHFYLLFINFVFHVMFLVWNSSYNLSLLYIPFVWLRVSEHLISLFSFFFFFCFFL